MDLTAKPHRCLLAIVDHGTYAAAAQAMAVSQPALSAMIKELERQIGFALFDRSGRRAILTASGHRYLDYARRLVVETEWISRAARDIRLDAVHLGTAHHSQLIPKRNALIDRFVSENPDQALVITNHYQTRLVEELAAQRIDIAIGLEPDVRGEVSHLDGERTDHLVRHVLGYRSVGLLVPAEDSLAIHEIVPEALLAHRTVLSIGRQNGIFVSEVIARWMNSIGAERRRAPEGDAAGVLRHAAVIRSPAIELGWFRPAPAANSGEMHYRAVAGSPPTIALVAMRDRRALRGAAQRFWDYIVEQPCDAFLRK
ncbi:LysR family transcriptional regulator [Sphingobium sp. 3R8]|uniref:LysR family transcriptional regulator n=1 Tax=Sphingobium sp. 3R8 TaxID=2874921 RepID=UPI001CCF6A0E|nr:LysR family transcriptional regulator [Sphingobium sp. 3R8]MBZ9646866.1 LysR family transcriptional regulator [Sphingobium sp. 3R8]